MSAKQPLYAICLLTALTSWPAHLQATPSDRENLLYSDACESEIEESRQMNCLFEKQGIEGILSAAEKAEEGGHPEIAFRLYVFASRKGSPAGSYNVGVFYETGEVVDKNLATAMDYYGKSAAAEFVPAYFNMGNLFCQADFEANKNDCIYWLLRSFQAGDLDGGYNLAIFLIENDTDWAWAEVLLNMAAEQGHEPSAFLLEELK
ncbi:sel1 repeat family protein [Labrenzia sp. DG1229]|uniref:tetratricopeptide repeat protein n=1 Tax=Labrenzia sp. DG1229 TaxID=681847 RepID=UPI00048A6932|nr:sel1 repeat family protein [Labrenzia sp. DG1229]